MMALPSLRCFHYRFRQENIRENIGAECTLQLLGADVLDAFEDAVQRRC